MEPIGHQEISRITEKYRRVGYAYYRLISEDPVALTTPPQTALDHGWQAKTMYTWRVYIYMEQHRLPPALRASK